MDIDWGAAAAIFAAVLVFVASVWRITEDRSVLRRLERLVQIRATMSGTAQSKEDVDISIEYLSARVVKRETPRRVRSIVQFVSLFIALIGFAALVTAMLLHGGAPEEGDGIYPLFLTGTAMAAVGLGASALVLFHVINEPFVEITRLIFQNLFPRR